jgi:MFS transporter, DHA2 family, lincomycin resistance protein
MPLTTESLGTLPDHLSSHGSAILSTLQQVAGALGAAVFVTVAALGATDPAGTPEAAGLRTAFVVAGCLGLLALAASFFVGARPASPAAEETTDDRRAEVAGRR